MNARLKLVKTLPRLPRRERAGNKGDYGKVVVLGGSRGMTGAPCLAARAAYRSGAGLVRVVVPETVWDIVAVKLNECTSAGLPATPVGSFAENALQGAGEHVEWADVLVVGPGASRHEQTEKFIHALVTTAEKPLVLDADGLNAFAGSASKLQHKFPRVLTPHPGEMARLLSRSITEVQADRERAVRDCVALTGGVVVLKGAGTLVADGTRLYQNQTGNPGMASGGTGDVLSGMIGALIGQGLSTFDAACLGVYLHGRAGDLVARRIGQHSLIASDLIEALPAAIAKLK